MHEQKLPYQGRLVVHPYSQVLSFATVTACQLIDQLGVCTARVCLRQLPCCEHGYHGLLLRRASQPNRGTLLRLVSEVTTPRLASQAG